jgi:hypothetical protein
LGMNATDAWIAKPRVVRTLVITSAIDAGANGSADFAQIIAEGITGEPARPGAGASRAERVLPPTGPQDGVHRTWYNRSSRGERQLFGRIAAQLGVHPSHVREVARGRSKSETVIAALKAEGVPILTEGKAPVGRHPNTLAALASSRQKRLGQGRKDGSEE